MTSLLKSILSHNSGGVHKSPSFSDLSMGASSDGAFAFPGLGKFLKYCRCLYVSKVDVGVDVGTQQLLTLPGT